MLTIIFIGVAKVIVRYILCFVNTAITNLGFEKFLSKVSPWALLDIITFYEAVQRLFIILRCKLRQVYLLLFEDNNGSTFNLAKSNQINNKTKIQNHSL